MKVTLREIFTCSFCNKHYFIKNACIKHEDRCFKNPENHRPCFNCYNLDKKQDDYYEDSPYGETSRTVTLFFCKIKKAYIYPPLITKKGNAFDMGYIENIEMPIICSEQDKIQP